MRSSKSWFLNISDELKLKCMDELSLCKFMPPLNFKDAEQTHKDFQRPNEVEGGYYLNIVEELNDFD